LWNRSFITRVSGRARASQAERRNQRAADDPESPCFIGHPPEAILERGDPAFALFDGSGPRLRIFPREQLFASSAGFLCISEAPVA
jgi:hypothetical protein